MRLFPLTLSALVVAGLATPAWGAQPPNDPPPSGWRFTGSQLVWQSPKPVGTGDAAIEFWSGDRLVGRPVPSPDHRTFTLDRPAVRDLGDLQVRAAGRRLDAPERLRPSASKPLAPPAPLPAGGVDPGKPGPFQTQTGEYTLDPLELPDYKAAPIEVQGVVVAPKGAHGPRPLALFLHGRHYTCYKPEDPEYNGFTTPCPSDTKPVPSYRGYLQAQQLLASQGYVTVSISANSINTQDARTQDAGASGRSALIRHHLARWADWAGAGRGSAPDVVKSSPVADLAKVFLAGHSRGGEGVNRAAADSLSPPPGDTNPARWTIRGAVHIGPTIFGHNPAPDVPSVTFLPGCDGDVRDLQGQMFLDATRGVSRGAALHSALYMVGANHNFFNTEWTPGQSVAPSSDDFFSDQPDAVCSPGTPTRLTPQQQQTAGATYIAAAAQLFVGGDQRVLPLLDGSGVRAPSADPARVLSHAVGGARTPFVVPDEATTANGSGRMCNQVGETATMCAATLEERWRTPHAVTFRGLSDEPGRQAVNLTWSAAGQAAVVRPGKAVSLLGSRALALRLLVPENTAGSRFDVAITDTSGHRTQLGSVSLDGLPGTERVSSYWAQEVRVPLPYFGIDLRNVASLELVPSTANGKALLVDAYGWNHGTPDPRPVALPRVDVGPVLQVDEGDSGTQTYQIPVTVTGSGPGTVLVTLSGKNSSAYEKRLVTLQPGQHTIHVPVDVAGNTLWGYGWSRQLLVKAVHGTSVGTYAGGVIVRNDDPAPKLTIEPTAHAVEGGVLTWRATLSAPTEDAYFVSAGPDVPAGPELSTTDVAADWFAEYSWGEEQLPSRPLSDTRVNPRMVFEPETPTAQTAELTVPTVADGEAEPTEHVRLVVRAREGEPQEVTGTVTEQP